MWILKIYFLCQELLLAKKFYTEKKVLFDKLARRGWYSILNSKKLLASQDRSKG